MAFTNMLQNQGMSPQAATTGGGSYGNGFLGTFANLALGNPQQGQGSGTKFYNAQGTQVGGEGADPAAVELERQRLSNEAEAKRVAQEMGRSYSV